MVTPGDGSGELPSVGSCDLNTIDEHLVERAVNPASPSECQSRCLVASLGGRGYAEVVGHVQKADLASEPHHTKLAGATHVNEFRSHHAEVGHRLTTSDVHHQQPELPISRRIAQERDHHQLLLAVAVDVSHLLHKQTGMPTPILLIGSAVSSSTISFTSRLLNAS